MILIWLLEMAAALWMVAPYTEPGMLAALLVIGLVSGLYMAHHDPGAFRGICGFGAGIVILLGCWYAGQHQLVGAGVIAVAGLVGVLLILGSLAAIATGQGGAR